MELSSKVLLDSYTRDQTVWWTRAHTHTHTHSVVYVHQPFLKGPLWRLESQASDSFYLATKATTLSKLEGKQLVHTARVTGANEFV